MKKVLLFTAMAFAGFAGYSQTTFGIQAGANFASIKFESDGGTDQTSDTKVGFVIGGLADIDFGNSIGFRPELNFIQKGGKFDFTQTESGFTIKEKSESKFSYIQLAPNFVYNFTAGTGKVFVGVGPEFSFGIGGKSKYETSITGPGFNESEEGENDVKFDGDDEATDDKDHYKAFDYGATAIAGYKLANGAFISVGYTLGLANISPYDDEDGSVKNRGFNVKIGFMFGGKSSE